jgi:hypothetical protein
MTGKVCGSMTACVLVLASVGCNHWLNLEFTATVVGYPIVMLCVRCERIKVILNGGHGYIGVGTKTIWSNQSLLV